MKSDSFLKTFQKISEMHKIYIIFLGFITNLFF